MLKRLDAINIQPSRNSVAWNGEQTGITVFKFSISQKRLSMLNLTDSYLSRLLPSNRHPKTNGETLPNSAVVSSGRTAETDSRNMLITD